MRQILTVIVALSLIFVIGASPALARPCLDPAAESAATPRYYVDAVRGSDAADGRSPATAWRSLAMVVHNRALNPALRPGARIVLANGNYGPLAIANLRGASPPRPDGKVDYIGIVAAPGAHPVLSSLWLSGVERFLVSGVTIQSQGGFTRFGALLRIDGRQAAPARDIRVTGNTLTSGGNYQAWSQAEWAARVAWAGIALHGDALESVGCMVFSGNHIHGVGIGAVLGGEDIRFERNHIHDFGNDGIDISGNRLDIIGNRVTDNLALGIAGHNDLIQGLRARVMAGPDGRPGFTDVTWTDVHIIGNVLMRQSRPGSVLSANVQGVTGFADTWERLVVANNVVVLGGPVHLARDVFFNRGATGEMPFTLYEPCIAANFTLRRRPDPAVNAENLATMPRERLGAINACGFHALTFASVRHGAIVNNTLITDNPTMAMIGVWIAPRPDSAPTCDTIIANNLGNWLGLSAIAPTLTAMVPSAADRQDACTPGRERNFASSNLALDATRPGGIDPTRVFRRFTALKGPARWDYVIDLRPRPGSPAIAAGNAAMARAALGMLAERDIDGRLRRKSDIGAYAF